MQDLEFFTLLETAIRAAKKGGDEITKVYEQEIEVEQKDDNSPLTIADKNANEVITEMLETTKYPILSEEGKSIPYNKRKAWKYFWMVDPLDGTKEFIKRNGEFTVNIALMDKNYPIMGVIYVPAKNKMYIGYLGKTAFSIENYEDFDILGSLILKGERLRKIKVDRPFTAVGSRSHMSPETEEYINKLKKNYKEVEVISMGSSLKICLVAEKKADVYPRFAPTMEWDTAAGQAIAEGAGMLVLNYETGERLAYNKENLLNPWFIVKRKKIKV